MKSSDSNDSRRRLVAFCAVLGFTLAAGWAASSPFSPGAPGPLLGAGEVLGYAAPGSGPVHFRGRLDRGSVHQGGDGALRMELVLAADAPDARIALYVPTDLIVVLDRSGSMQGKPMHDARAAVHELIDGLSEGDRFALVTYSSQAHLAIAPEAATSEARQRWHAAVDRIGVGGGTNMASGLDLADATFAHVREAGRAPRVLLLSDGHANEGDHSLEGLRARAARAVAAEYVLSTVGVGTDFDEVMMTSLADAGTGNYYYVQHSERLAGAFNGEFASARETVARGLVVEIELAPGVELLDAAGYPVERDGRVARFRPGDLFGGQERRVWLRLRAPTDAVGERALGDFRLVYRRAGAEAETETLRFAQAPRVACVANEEQYIASFDADLMLEAIAKDELGALKQDVAIAVREGRAEEAKRVIDAYRLRNATVYRQLEVVPEEQEAFAEAEALAARVQATFAAPAAERPQRQKKLGKSLSAEGTDGRRAGAKY